MHPLPTSRQLQPSAAPLLVLLLLLSASTALHGASAAGLLAADSVTADLKLAAKSKGRKEGPTHNLGSLPTGVAFDGEPLTLP